MRQLILDIIIIAMLFVIILITWIHPRHARGADFQESPPATISYITSNIEVVDLEQLVRANPACQEHKKVHDTEYRRIASDKDCGKRLRYRHWICRDTYKEGVDVEEYQGKPCPLSEYDRLRELLK